MLKAILLCAALFGLSLATRETDFHANHAWWTDLDSLNTDNSGYRRMCFVGVYNQPCDTSVDTWVKMRSMALPTTNATSYSGTLTNYKVCRKQSTNYYYRLDTACLAGWTEITNIYLITDGTGWSISFTTSGTTYHRRLFNVYTTDNTPLVSHLIVPDEQFDPNDGALYTYSYSFYAYY